jgi:hypothetical protein
MLRVDRRYDPAYGHASVEDRRGLGRDIRNAVSRLAEAAGARLRTIAASDPRRLRDVRHAVAGPRQRDSRLPRAERRCACGRLREDAAVGKHEGRFRRRGSRRDQRPRTRLVGWDDRPGQGVRHRSVLRRQHEPSRRMPRHDGALIDEPGNGPALRTRLSGDHGRRYGADGARVPERARGYALGRHRRRSLLSQAPTRCSRRASRGTR